MYSYDFVKYDDNTYITDNVNIQSGFNWESFGWAFTSGYASNWHPVTWLSHIADYQLFKDWAGGYHLVNVLFHILNTVILFYVLAQMTGAVWPSAFVAAAFALHPLHIESVAWVAERKDVLSTFFLLLTIWAYTNYVKNLKVKWYLAAFAMFAMGLMSKPMLVTVPFVLLLLDYWPLQRKISYRLAIEKIPFFICSIGSCIVTFLVQQKGGAMVIIESFGPATRINNAVVSYIIYIVKMIWPVRLAVLYPHPGSSLSAVKIIICASLLVLISIYFIYIARRHKFFAVGWLWYLGMLVPVIGLVQVGAQAMADRYTYMTLTGLFIIIAWSAKEFVPRRRYGILVLSAAAILISSAVTAGSQLRYWKNSLTLFEHTLGVTENNYFILSNQAAYLNETGRFDEAIGLFNKLLKIRPNSAETHNNLGNALAHIGKIQQAIEHYNLAIKYKPELSEAYRNLANTLKNNGRLEEAVSYYEQALKIKPNNIETYLALAATFNELNRFDQSMEYCYKILAIDRDNVFARGYLGLGLAANGKIDEAIKEIRFVLNARPDDVAMYCNLGILLERKGQTAEAIEAYRRVLQIDPKQTVAHQLLEAALKK
ncbi:MAG: tetratricopeptide repeat protein [Phycisphaerae bacterium]|nr:tetratricopeptide repeat protein [Phycisphaerae bacterium]